MEKQKIIFYKSNKDRVVDLLFFIVYTVIFCVWLCFVSDYFLNWLSVIENNTPVNQQVNQELNLLHSLWF